MTTSTSLTPARAREIYSQSVVVDGSIAPLMDEGQIARMKASGITAFNWTICHPWESLAETLHSIAEGLEIIAAHPDDLCLIRTAADIDAAKAAGKVGLIFGPQNASPADSDHALFRIFHELGIRIFQLTYNDRNLYGDGATEPANAGLSNLGREAIKEMNRLGILIDVSHCGDRTTLETIEASEQPIAITHANARTVFNSPRNKTDDMLKLLAERNGVIGMTLWTPMVGNETGGWPTLADFVRHVDYTANLIGVEHIAIGTDHSEGAPREPWEAKFGVNGAYRHVVKELGEWYGYDTRFPQDGQSCTDMVHVVDALSELRFTESEFEGVLGGNFMRLFREVWGS